jgi:hypothetical protein
MKFYKTKITETQTKFSPNFGGKLSFVPSFSWAPPLPLHTYSFTAPTCITIIITLKPCALNDELSAFHTWDSIKFPYFVNIPLKEHFILRFNKISLLCGYHWKRDAGGEGDNDFMDNLIIRYCLPAYLWLNCI